jgi:hypothetical protein
MIHPHTHTYRVVPHSQLITIVFHTCNLKLITIVNGVYKPSFNWGAADCSFSCLNLVRFTCSLDTSGEFPNLHMSSQLGDCPANMCRKSLCFPSTKTRLPVPAECFLEPILRHKNVSGHIQKRVAAIPVFTGFIARSAG